MVAWLRAYQVSSSCCSTCTLFSLGLGCKCHVLIPGVNRFSCCLMEGCCYFPCQVQVWWYVVIYGVEEYGAVLLEVVVGVG